MGRTSTAHVQGSENKVDESKLREDKHNIHSIPVSPPLFKQLGILFVRLPRVLFRALIVGRCVYI